MISRAHRFSGPKSLNFVYQNGQLVRGPQFGLKAALNPRRQTWRAAVVISRKIHKSAVARNRMRRRLYDSLHQLESRISDPYDIVITVFNDQVLEQEAKALKQQLERQLKQAGILSRIRNK